MKIIRHMASFLLPVSALIVVPLLIEKDFSLRWLLTGIIGCLLIVSGLAVIVSTIRMFVRIGNGTLAPWDPTRKLVTGGLYGHVRNPMILAALLVLFGESILFSSYSIGIWAVLFFIINTIYFIFSEEPGLEKRFKTEYVEYKKHVPRWIPRIKPWHPGKE